MNKDDNLYTFLFATVMVVIVASALAFTATSLKPKQLENIRKEKMQNILKTIDVNTDRNNAEKEFRTYIKQEISLTAKGTEDKKINAFEIDLAKELKKDIDDQRFPLFVADVQGKTYYIVPLRGRGLWDAIWGYISLESDFNTVKGVALDHKGETAGLGAEITKDWFQKRFEGETIFDDSHRLTGIIVLKGNEDPNGNDKTDHEVDAISGATITGNGVTEMILERLTHYALYVDKMELQ